MKAHDFTVTVVNITDAALKRKYIVARCAENELWYYNAWDDRAKAVQVANELENALVITNTEVE